MKNNKGITLIALVITIIVMLILVTVTIRVATNGNLFTHAANAAKGTKTAIEGENAILDGSVGNKSIEKIVAEATGNITYTAYEVGDTVTVGGESFYVIEDSGSSTSTVKLLAALNVETDSNSANYNKQNASASTVAFDSTEPYTNDYNATSNPPTIKGLVDSYVSSLGVAVQEGRLMLLAEVVELGGDDENNTTEDCPSFINVTNFWLGSPCDFDSGRACRVNGEECELQEDGLVSNAIGYGLRPVIVILKSNI